MSPALGAPGVPPDLSWLSSVFAFAGILRGFCGVTFACVL